jgi:Flp pilus assembly protein TadG
MIGFIAQFANRIRRLADSTGGRFARCQEGIAAVEFGLVAAPFLALLFAIMETAIVFLPGRRWRPPLPIRLA